MAGTLSRRWRFAFNFLATVLLELRAGIPLEFISVSRLAGAYNIRVFRRESQFGLQLEVGVNSRCRELLRNCQAGKDFSADGERIVILRVFVVDWRQALPRRREESPSFTGIDLLGYVLKMIETEEVF